MMSAPAAGNKRAAMDGAPAYLLWGVVGSVYSGRPVWAWGAGAGAMCVVGVVWGAAALYPVDVFLLLPLTVLLGSIAGRALCDAAVFDAPPALSGRAWATAAAWVAASAPAVAAYAGVGGLPVAGGEALAAAGALVAWAAGTAALGAPARRAQAVLLFVHGGVWAAALARTAAWPGGWAYGPALGGGLGALAAAGARAAGLCKL